MVNIVCPDCGKNIGAVEESESGLVVKARVRDFPTKQQLGAPQVQELKAKVGHVPSTKHFVTVPLAPTGPPTAFECPKHGYFEVPDADLRNAAHRKSKRLPAHRRL